MPYATKQALVDRFGQAELIQLTDRSHRPPTTIDDTVLAQAMADANDEVDASVGVRYSLPLAAAPPILVRCACDLARFVLYDVRATEEVRNRAKDARAMLKAISTGAVTLGLETPPPSLGAPETDGPDRIFDRDTLKDYWP